jgi:hypothetical protein
MKIVYPVSWLQFSVIFIFTIICLKHLRLSLSFGQTGCFRSICALENIIQDHINDTIMDDDNDDDERERERERER